jgi:predicted DNA-binding transcriptional regulator YafY
MFSVSLNEPANLFPEEELIQAVNEDACERIFAEDEANPYLEDFGLEQEPVKGGIHQKKAFNGTAYRIFKLLQWLMETPLTLEELNERFVQDPLIGKAVSNDTVWLYTNTLKKLGCAFRRPSPKNKFHYELKTHPFGIALPPARQEMLVLAKAFAQQSFDHREMLILDNLFKNVICHSAVSSVQESIEALFQQSRSFDFESSAGYIHQLEAGVKTEALFQLHYRSPLQGEETFEFMPEMLYYEQGVPYVRGDRPDKNLPSSLRIDRIVTLRPIVSDETRIALIHRRQHKTRVHLRLFVPQPALWMGLGLEPQHGVYQENKLGICTAGRAFVELELLVRDFFYLKQRLLASRYQVQILSPQHLKEDLQQTLQQVLAHYKNAQPVEASKDGLC